MLLWFPDPERWILSRLAITGNVAQTMSEFGLCVATYMLVSSIKVNIHMPLGCYSAGSRNFFFWASLLCVLNDVRYML